MKFLQQIASIVVYWCRFAPPPPPSPTHIHAHTNFIGFLCCPNKREGAVPKSQFAAKFFLVQPSRLKFIKKIQGVGGGTELFL